MRLKSTIILCALSVTSFAQTDSIRHDSLQEVEVIGISATETQPITQSKFKTSEYQFLNQQGDPFFVLQRATPAIYAQSDNGQENGYSYLRLRGLDQTRINFTLNGIPLNEMEDQGLYFSNIPGFYNSLSSVNVVRGVGTSKYGNSSIAGSVDMETRSMSDKSIDVNSILYNNYGNQFINTNLSTGIMKSGLSVQGGGSYIRNGGFKDHSYNEGGSIYYSLGYIKNKNILKLYGIHGLSLNNLAFYGVPMSVLNENYQANLNAVTDRDTFQQNLVVGNWVNYTNAKYKFNTSVYFSNVNGTYSTGGILFGVNSYQVGAMSNMVMERKGSNTNIGINANIYKRNHFGSDNGGYYDYPENSSRYENTGYKQDVIGYVKTTIHTKALDVSLDAQLRGVHFNATDSKDYNWFFFNPKIGVKTNDKGFCTMYINAGMTQREPTRTDLIQNIIQSDTLNRYGNPDNTTFLKNNDAEMKPETAYNIEVGSRFRKSFIEVNTNLFWMMIKNEYVATGVIDPYSGFMVKTLVPTTFRQGFEANVKVHYNRVSAFYNLALLTTEIVRNDGSYQIPFAPKFLGSLGAIYKTKYVNVGITEQSVSSMVMSYDDQGVTSTPYHVLNAFTDLIYNNCTLSFKINNILNDKYYIPAGVGATPTYYAGQLVNYTLHFKLHF